MILKIATLRKEAGYSSQEQLSEKADIPRSTIAKWEAGITSPSVQNLKKLSVALNCTIDDLLAPQDTDHVQKL